MTSSVGAVSSQNDESIIAKMATQSTIYRRHEARLRKSYETQDDTRPAVVRVLSGLPGFRMFVPPYDELRRKREERLQATANPDASTTASPAVTVFSEDTVFATHGGGTVDAAKEPHVPSDKLFSSSMPQLASGCVGGGTAAALGSVRAKGGLTVVHHLAAGSSLTSSAGANMTVAAAVPQPVTGGALAATVSASSTAATPSSSPFTTTGVSRVPRTGARVVAGAASSGLLFGANAQIKSQVGANTDPLSPTFLASSALAGIVSASVFAPWELVRTRLIGRGLLSSHTDLRACLQEMTSVIHRQGFLGLYRGGLAVYGREVPGVTAYFSTYELLRSRLSATSSKASTTDIAAAGAGAGVAYWAVVYPFDSLRVMTNHHSHSPAVGQQQLRLSTTMAIMRQTGLANLYRGFLRCILRAAPANAVLFLAYETSLRCLLTDQS